MNPFSRRQFIKIGAASTLTIPFLETLSSTAEAATASGSLKRVLFICLTNGWYEDVIFPKSPAYLTGAEGVRYVPLSSFTGDISQMFTAAKYGSIKSKMNIMRGLDLLSAAEGGGGHRQCYALGATDERSSGSTKNTIDNVIAAAPGFYPSTPFKTSMNAVAASGNDSWRYNYSYKNGTERPYLEGPSKIFAEYFSGVSLPSTGGTSTPTTPTDTNLTRRVALNSSINKLSAMAKSSRFSKADQTKLQEHADLINKLLPTLAPPVSGGGTGTGVGASCSTPTLATNYTESMSSTANNGNRLKSAMDLIYMTFNCQLTNVAVLHPIIAADNEALPMGDDTGDKYHQIAGHNHQISDYLKYKGFIFDNILYLAKKMDSIKESNGLSMLDNSLIAVVSNDACGVHSTQDIPVITFGSLGGTLKTGNFINYQRTDAPLNQLGGQDGYRYSYNLGRPYNSFFTTVLNALKISHSGFGEYYNVSNAYSQFISTAGKQASLPILS